jgi:hypothetical protein
VTTSLLGRGCWLPPPQPILSSSLVLGLTHSLTPLELDMALGLGLHLQKGRDDSCPSWPELWCGGCGPSSLVTPSCCYPARSNSSVSPRQVKTGCWVLCRVMRKEPRFFPHTCLCGWGRVALDTHLELTLQREIHILVLKRNCVHVCVLVGLNSESLHHLSHTPSPFAFALFFI